MKKVLIISTSLRNNSNSEILAKSFYEGAKINNDVEFISLKDKTINFCKGCLACGKTHRCIINDDTNAIVDKMEQADVIVWATPIYYYEMSGQMKVLIDRLNPMFTKDYKFRDVYFLAAAAEDDKAVPQRAIEGTKGWIECFDKASFKGYVFCGGVTDIGDIKEKESLREAYEMGLGTI